MKLLALFYIYALGLLGTGATILNIGKPREPITPGAALAVIIIQTLVFISVAYLYLEAT